MTQADARRSEGGGEAAEDVVYVYGIVRDGFDAGRVPEGIDDAAVRATRASKVAALASRLPRSVYGAGAIDRNSGDVTWLSPRAMAHDRVLTWAHDHGGVVPLPMFSMWESEESLARWLADRAAELSRVFDKIADADEFGLRVHRRDAIMMQSIDDIDPAMAELKKEAAAASPGQRDLLERKRAERGKGAVRAASQRLSQEIFQQLRARSRDATSLPLTPSDAGGGKATEGTLVLNGAFLVDRRRNEDFRAAVAALARDHERRGLAFDFTGPWPPYNFVGEPRAAARAQ
jgi:hypothetical protein